MRFTTATNRSVVTKWLAESGCRQIDSSLASSCQNVRMGARIDLTGEHVRIRSTTAADRSALVVIRATEEVRRRWRGDDFEREFDEDLDDEAVTQLTIETPDGRIVGMIQFAEEEDYEYRHASLDIYVDPAAARRGYASDAIRQLSDFLFDERGHHRLTIDPAADNTAAIVCYSSAGFKTVGLMRSYELQSDGTWGDGLLMELLASDRCSSDDPVPLAEVRDAELMLLDPEVRRNGNALAALLHHDFVEIGSSGRRWTKSEIIAELHASPSPGLLKVEEMHARWVSRDVALVTYRTVSAEATVLRSSWWLHQDSRWLILFHQGTTLRRPW